VLTAAASAPVALCVLFPRSRARDAATVSLQMWAYLAGYEMPNDDPEALRARVHLRYPVTIDRAIGLGTLPNVRLQRAFADPDRFHNFEKVLVWCHWVWFLVPHGAVTYVLVRHRERFPAAAVGMYATFDLGLIAYWKLPTAPPWYAAQLDVAEEGKTPELRRMMVEYGEEFWKSGWAPMFDFLAGNPLAAMPSLHFATSVMAARVLNKTGPVAGALGWGYAATLGVALVYLGEHYVVDLAAGYALTELVRRSAPTLTPVGNAISRAVQRLEARAA
jgi:membrane-associated phospholipid phosphatase